MASGYDISASTSSSTANNSAAGPATSGGVSVGNVTAGGSTGSAGLSFTAPGGGGLNVSNVALIVIGGALIWYLVAKK